MEFAPITDSDRPAVVRGTRRHEVDWLRTLTLDASAKLLLLTAGTFGVSLLLYEVIRRLKWIRPLFGMKLSYG